MIEIRPARPEDRAAIVEIMHHGWHDAHADLVPPEVIPQRTPEHIDDIYGKSADGFHVAVEDGHILGFVAVNEDELTKLFIARRARGSGVAKALLVHAERMIAQAGYDAGRLYCQLGNDRAERFYIRNGWVEDHRGEYELWQPSRVRETHSAISICLVKKLVRT